MSKNDEKIMRLKKTIEERKAALGEKKSFTPKTSCSLEFEGQRYNLHATNDYSTLAYILCKLHAIEMAAGDLNIYAGAILICGYPVSDWVADLKSKIEVVARMNREKELKEFERKLDALLSADKKTELEIDSIAEMLG